MNYREQPLSRESENIKKNILLTSLMTSKETVRPTRLKIYLVFLVFSLFIENTAQKQAQQLTYFLEAELPGSYVRCDADYTAFSLHQVHPDDVQ